MKKVAKKEGQSQNGTLAAADSKLLEKLSALVQHCCCRAYDDNEVRTPGWFTVKTIGAAWCVQVKDPDSCCSFVATAATLDDALLTAELLLGTPDAPWEHDKWLAKGAPRKGKK